MSTTRHARSRNRRPPFFILGAQRSGTTLLRLLLNAHPEVAIPEEGTFLMPLLRRRNCSRVFHGKRLQRILDYLESHPQLQLWAIDAPAALAPLRAAGQADLRSIICSLYEAYAAHHGKPSWGDKTPSFFRKGPVLHCLFPKARFIHLVRDGRDVFSSWRKYDPTKDLPAAAALDWTIKVRSVERFFAHLPQDLCHTVRYEDLVQDTECALRSICAFLGLDYLPSMLAFHKTSGAFIGKHHSDKIFRAVDPGSAAAWRARLTANEARIYTTVAQTTLRRYSYPVADMTPSLAGPLLVLPRLIVELPRRTWQVWRAAARNRLALATGRPATGLPVGLPPEQRPASVTPARQADEAAPGQGRS